MIAINISALLLGGLGSVIIWGVSDDAKSGKDSRAEGYGAMALFVILWVLGFCVGASV